MTALTYRRTKRITSGKSRYINFAQDEKGKIVSWGYWNHTNNKKTFLDNIKKRKIIPTFRSGTLRLVLTVKYSSPKGTAYYFMGEAFMDINYEIKQEDELIIKEIVNNAFEGNEMIIDAGLKMFNDFVGTYIPYDSVECRVADHYLENSETHRNVDIKVFVRGIEKTNIIETLGLSQAVEGVLDELEG